jgi:D-cysteine desulfhydrase
VKAPTPVFELPSLGLWVKDDSVIGGNKVRKLAHTIPDAQAKGKRTVLTFGAIGSNHCVATAEACRAAGLACICVLVDQPEDEHVRRNLGRMRDAGARTVLAHGSSRAAIVAGALIARHRPYVLPVGGSSEVGIRGFVDAGEEVVAQVAAGALPQPRTVVIAVGSGGSAVGLAQSSLEARIVGVVVNDRSKFRTHPGVDYVRDFLGAGYGHPTPEGEEAKRRAAAAGLELESVYTAKAMAAALALELEPPVLFWNTYAGVGNPA